MTPPARRSPRACHGPRGGAVRRQARAAAHVQGKRALVTLALAWCAGLSLARRPRRPDRSPGPMTTARTPAPGSAAARPPETAAATPASALLPDLLRGDAFVLGRSVMTVIS